ncbi:MAG: hypothetical protein E6K19_08880, partial [Methanobacteriota archaeon]
MNFYFRDDLDLLKTSEELSRLAREMLKLIAGKTRRVDPKALRDARMIMEQAGAGVDDVEFIQALVTE